MKILMVCLGNICRSPLAEGILRSKLVGQLPDLYIDSAGTGGWHAGQSPDTRSIAIAQEYGIDISEQKARKFETEDFEKFDLIFAMDRSNFNDLIALKPSNSTTAKVHLLLEYASIADPVDVPDPYYGEKQEFTDVFLLLENACSKIAYALIKSSKRG